MPNVKVLIEFEQCFNVDGTINESLFNSLAERGLLDDMTLVVKEFHMDGKLAKLKNHLWWDYRYTVFKEIISPHDLYLINLGNNQYKLGDAARSQKWADEKYCEIEADIKKYKAGAILEDILQYYCIRLLLDKGLIGGTTTIAELRQSYQNKEFAINLFRQLLPGYKKYNLAMPDIGIINYWLNCKEPLMHFDCQALLHLDERLSKLDDQNQTIVDYYNKLFGKYEQFNQYLDKIAETKFDANAYLYKHRMYIWYLQIARNLSFVSQLRTNEEKGLTTHQVVDVNQYYLAQLPVHENNAVLYFGDPMNLPQPAKSLPVIHHIQSNASGSVTESLDAIGNQLLNKQLQKLGDFQGQNPDTVSQKHIDEFIQAINQNKQAHPKNTLMLYQLVELLNQALLETNAKSISECQDYLLRREKWIDITQPPLMRTLLAILIDLQLKNLREISKTKNGQLIKSEVDAVIKAIIKIQQSEPDKRNDLLTIANTAITALKDPTPENIKTCQTLAKQVQGQASPLWQGLGIALMALGAALIILGALVATSTVGLATIPGASLITAGVTATQAGIGTVAIGSAALLNGSLFTFFGQKSGLVKSLDNLNAALEKANLAPKPTSDAVTAPLLQKP